MRSLTWIAVCLACVVALGCSSHNSPAPAAASPNAPPIADNTASAAPAAPDASAAPVDPDATAPPDGAMFSLLCATYAGPTHIVDAKRAKDSLIHITNSKGWYVVHGENESSLFYGYYKTFNDRSQPEEYERAQSDRAKVASLLDATGDRLFAEVIFVPISLPDPPAPKEWELSRNPGFWTLQIAIYRDSPQRKQYAVDAVRDARARGIDAYYHHSIGTSEVYVGSWPREAVKEQESDTAKADEQDEPLLVLSGPIAGTEGTDFYTKDGRKMKVVMPKLEVLDPHMKNAIAQYPNTYINGELRGRKRMLPNGTTTVDPYPSMLVTVPHDGDDQNQGATGNSDSQTNHASGDAPADSGLGHLR